MYSGGNVTIYVSSIQRSIDFYADTLGLKLAYRFGEQFAAIHAGKGLTIGLHPASAQAPAGLRGSMSIGLEISGSIDEAVRKLEQKGVQFFGAVSRDKAGAFAFFADPDGTPIYLVELNSDHVAKGEGQYAHA
ncbi:MAG: VOC family protein [Acidobacteria bacterium]|nr:VOC family protein [Acidobacteriota bacterium]